ncbi:MULTISPECIES: IS66 family insertion sequence element accessory protein TnpA [unclassified Endozoicomonas]|uniref:IS66 family insertion sequence element accessory protein TnpA n=1 Tax=unclassified Endozoicomonas TaxID=2644528 RepID=UPI003BB5809B
MTTPETTKEQWLQRIEAWHDSGLSQKAWCRQNGVRPSQLGYWKKKLWAGNAPASSSNTRTAFVPVSLAQRQDQTGQASSVLTVSLPNGLSVSGIDHNNLTLAGQLIGLLQ